MGVLILLSVPWGASFLFMKVALQELPIVTIVFSRVWIASLSRLVLIKVFNNEFPKGIKVWRAFFIMDFTNNVVPFSLLVWGMAEIASGLAAAGATNIALVKLLVPVSAIIFGWLILGETLLTNHLIGMAVITLGLLAVGGRLWAGSNP